MNTILLDTNAYSRYVAGDRIVAEYITNADIVYLSTVVIGELCAGFFSGIKYEENIKELYTILSRSYYRTIEVTLNTSSIYGAVWTDLKRKGTMIPTNDIWIAAHAVETDSQLITYDNHFLQIEGIHIWDELRLS
ncbi:PIN domain protein [Spirochaetia bacterium]|nr:PIN domain protein [Spirochaetia bacterium]